MSPFWWGVVVGLMIGVPFGFACLSIMVISGRSEAQSHRMGNEWRGR